MNSADVGRVISRRTQVRATVRTVTDLLRQADAQLATVVGPAAPAVEPTDRGDLLLEAARAEAEAGNAHAQVVAAQNQAITRLKVELAGAVRRRAQLIGVLVGVAAVAALVLWIAL